MLSAETLCLLQPGWTPASTLRVRYFLHLFSGSARRGELGDKLVQLGAHKGLRMIVINWDVLRGPEYDLRDPSNVRRLVDMLTSGVFAGVHAGPPCATWSPVLQTGGGPPNVRTRDHPWGRPDLYSLQGWAAQEELLDWGT